MKTIFYSKDAQFELSDDEYIKAMSVWNNGKSAFISRLNVSLSPLYIWAGEKPTNRKQLHDGGYAIKVNGFWVVEGKPDIKIDLKYYPELAKDLDIEIKQLYGKNNISA